MQPGEDSGRAQRPQERSNRDVTYTLAEARREHGRSKSSSIIVSRTAQCVMVSVILQATPTSSPEMLTTLVGTSD